MPTALLSVYDKTGIVELAAELSGSGWRLVSSGGTARAIAEAGIEVSDVEAVTGMAPILGHRVVTLHPKIHGGLLADPTDPDHRDDLAEYGIEPFSLLVANLYPFGEDPSTFEHGGTGAEDLIDIGGPAMVRAAAKNHAHVAVVADPSQYASVVAEIADHGEVTPAARRRLARDAFAMTSAYDAAVAAWFTSELPSDAVSDPESNQSDSASDRLPSSLTLELDRAEVLRYGENPHQRGARYRSVGSSGWWDRAVQHGGKALSYLNVYDAEAAWRLVHRFDEPACVVVKHANPCGVAVGTDDDDPIADAYRKANACDPVSAFGGIVAVNRPLTDSAAAALTAVFTEVVIAPAYGGDSLSTLTLKKNLRVLEAAPPNPWPIDLKPIDGGFIVQESDPVPLDRTSWTVATSTEPSDAQWDDLEFAWAVCAAVTSNAIVYAKDRQAFGIGAGQQNRLDSARIAAERSAGRAVGGVCASDAFFPFRDGLDAAAGAGIRAVIQPGGSVRDDEVVAAADEHGIAMVFTHTRHFRH